MTTSHASASTFSDVSARKSACSAVVGLQWGDEGKGKIVDLMAAAHDAVVRYNGGANAGHSVVVAVALAAWSRGQSAYRACRSSTRPSLG